MWPERRWRFAVLVFQIRFYMHHIFLSLVLWDVALKISIWESHIKENQDGFECSVQRLLWLKPTLVCVAQTDAGMRPGHSQLAGLRAITQTILNMHLFI